MIEAKLNGEKEVRMLRRAMALLFEQLIGDGGKMEDRTSWWTASFVA